MNNASCADCGRIVAFRTPDPTEIAECRSCGTWVKRTAELPGVAVWISHHEQPPQERWTPPAEQPPAVDSQEIPQAEVAPVASPFVEQATAPAGDPPQETDVSSSKRARRRGRATEDTISAATVQSALRELQDAVGTLQEGQRVLLARTLPVPNMPVSVQSPEEMTPIADIIEQLPLERKTRRPVTPKSFYTTSFSALKVPVIPITLSDLEIERNLTDGRVLAEPVPAQERSDRQSLIDEPLPVTARAGLTAAETDLSAVYTAAETDLSAADTADEGELEPQLLDERPSPEAETSESPPGNDFANPHLKSETPEVEDPFASPFFSDTPPPREEPVETPPTLPFAEEEGASQILDTPRPFNPEEGSLSLSDQIASAKEKEDTRRVSERSSTAGSSKDEKSAFAVLLAVLLALALLLGALGWLIYHATTGREASSGSFFDKIAASFKRPTTEGISDQADTPKPPLFTLPAYGASIPDSDERVLAAAAVAREFADTKSIAEVLPLIQPIERALLENFYEPMVGPTIKLYQARELAGDRIEVDFLVKDYGRPERLMPVVKVGEGPYLVNWQSFAECEELTLLSLTQGTLIIDGAVVDSGVVRGWMEHGQKESGDFPSSNYQGFRLQSITEEADAIAYARKGSPTLIKLVEALATTEIRFRGQPAIRAILRVRRIVEADPGGDSPTRLEIIEVLATDWRQDHPAASATEDSSPEETLPGGEADEQASDPASNSPKDLLPPIDGAPTQ